MNSAQKLWWEQTQSDYSVFHWMRKSGQPACHQLHYLQMVMEKLGKAYFWRSGSAPRTTHASFVRFLQALDSRSDDERDRIAKLLTLKSANHLEGWIRSVAPLAYELERLAPQLAGFAAPNAEYPWPHANPLHAPSSFLFPVWLQVTETTRGRLFLNLLEHAVRKFDQYA